MTSNEIITISFDDIDYPSGGCTTHLTGLFLAELSRRNIKLADFPGLVRLNPAIPWKTRGNAATFLRLYVNSADEALDIFEMAKVLVSEYSEERSESNKGPGVVLTFGKIWLDPRLRALYKKALTDVVTKDIVIKLLNKVKALYWGNYGIVGAAVAQAALSPGDAYTFELIAYRRPELWGTKRCIINDSLWRVEASLPPCVFNNYDIINNVLTAAPQGPDPILAGFRGTCPEYLTYYKNVLCEKPHFWILYRSNQHTDIHNKNVLIPRVYKSGSVVGIVKSKPKIISGGHVLVELSNNNNIEVMFFRETGPLREAAKLLEVGDVVEVVGSFRPHSVNRGVILAADKIAVKKVEPKQLIFNPRCPKCGHRMESSGKALRCPKCGYKMKKRYVSIFVKRKLLPLILTPQDGRVRHLISLPYSYNSRLPRIKRLPIKLNIDNVLSLNVNPPVIDPSVSTESH